MTEDLSELKQAIYYLNIRELKEICNNLQLPFSGQKGEIISRIISYIETGKIVQTRALPTNSKAKKGIVYALSPNSFILYGHYKNDLNTRNFMKTLVGEHFHFTAFGQDFIKQCWLEGKPPTYAEFADFWQKEYLARKNKQATPKQEWAYLNFIQKYLARNSTASKQLIAAEWQKEREANVIKTKQILSRFIRIL